MRELRRKDVFVLYDTSTDKFARSIEVIFDSDTNLLKLEIDWDSELYDIKFIRLGSEIPDVSAYFMDFMEVTNEEKKLCSWEWVNYEDGTLNWLKSERVIDCI